MRTLIGKSAALLAGSLVAGALLVPGQAAASTARSAPTAATSTASTAAAAPVRISVNYPYRVRTGRVVTFTIKLTNNLKTTTNEIFLAAKFPKNVTKTRIYVPKGSRYRERCTRERTRALCVLPGLKKGKSYTFYAKAVVSGSARGKLYGYFGGAVTDTSLDTDPRELLSEFGESIGWVKTKSSIVR